MVSIEWNFEPGLNFLFWFFILFFFLFLVTPCFSPHTKNKQKKKPHSYPHVQLQFLFLLYRASLTTNLFYPMKPLYWQFLPRTPPIPQAKAAKKIISGIQMQRCKYIGLDEQNITQVLAGSDNDSIQPLRDSKILIHLPT